MTPHIKTVLVPLPQRLRRQRRRRSCCWAASEPMQPTLLLLSAEEGGRDRGTACVGDLGLQVVRAPYRVQLRLLYGQRL